MDVQGAVRGGVEGVGKQYLAVGSDDEDVLSRDLLRRLGYATGLREWQVRFAGKVGDGGRMELAPSPAACVRLRYYEADFVGGLDEAVKYGGGEFRGARECYPQQVFPSASPSWPVGVRAGGAWPLCGTRGRCDPGS